MFCAFRRFLAIPLAALVFYFATSARGADNPPRVSAKELASAFVKGEAAAKKKYGDPTSPKELIVEGEVKEVVDGKFGKIARLEGDGKVFVSVLMRKEDVESVKKGDKVAFQGKCRGLFKKENLVDINGGVLVKNK